MKKQISVYVSDDVYKCIMRDAAQQTLDKDQVVSIPSIASEIFDSAARAKYGLAETPAIILNKKLAVEKKKPVVEPVVKEAPIEEPKKETVNAFKGLNMNFDDIKI